LGGWALFGPFRFAVLVIRQTAFGIRPVNVAGGTVKVKDEMKIVFDLVLAPVRP